MSVRKSVKEISKPKLVNNEQSFLKSYENKAKKWIVKFQGVIYVGFKKAVSTLLLLAVFSWFNINNANFVKGIASLISGDLSGLSLILDWESNVETLKEAWQVGSGTDYSWLRYKKESGKDLHVKFTYIGKRTSVMKDVAIVDDMVEGCKYECETIAAPVTVKEAKEFCEEAYGARILNKSEYEKIIGSVNPVIDPKLNKRIQTPEWTNNVNPKDGDDYYVYFKGVKKPESFLSESYALEGVYLDEDSDYNFNIGFRCIIELPY